ncbi:MAG: DNA/RNA helicase [Puniceicoccaceae bacterium 5H]|nr:MAG: DNA/RNA helicase [Puniceicoccaceae bacterium 5H]
MSELPVGLYERLLDEELSDLLVANPELRATLRAIDDEAAPHTYAQFVGPLVHQAMRIAKKEQRLPILNRLLELLASTDGLEFLQRKRLLSRDRPILTQISREAKELPRPETPLSISSLLTGQGADPPLEHELRNEMETADRVDILVSFIKWSGLRLLMPALEKLRDADVPIRIISTSYMGASDPAALEWLARLQNAEIRLSYDSGGTRLHAKAYHFYRESGYSTAYIGSANMSHSAMTQGLEWTLKVTAQDQPHILARFEAEFAAYWEADQFEPYDAGSFPRLRKVIQGYRSRSNEGAQFFAEITPRPFQQRILEALEAARQAGSNRNLVVAATGTGKTVISALDYKRHVKATGQKLPLLFVVHRKEILQQALGCFRAVLRDQNFGELLVDGQEPSDWRHVFASVQSLNHKAIWQHLGRDYFRFVIVDEAHHGAARSYRAIFDELEPEILLGLTATPERMDGSLILPDFDDRLAAEIRLPEALEEKLLCPFHYFGVTDSISLDDERFWKNGRYDTRELEAIFTGDDVRARQRVDLILQALQRYQPDLDQTRGVGFCAGTRHAHFMADHFRRAGIAAEVLLGETSREERAERLRRFREGELTFLFTVDVLSEGVDVPEIDLVLFLRPTESLTVFLQQLGRGLRHAPNKDCLTVLDFVGQTHRKYRLDLKFTALLSRRRQRIDREIEQDFPHLPPGCSIQLERVARERILGKIRSVLNDLQHFVPETLQTWESDTGTPLNFGNFIRETGLSPIELLSKRTWSEWKSMANRTAQPTDPDLDRGRKTLARLVLRTDPALVASLHNLDVVGEQLSEEKKVALHYLLWGVKGGTVGVSTVQESIAKWQANPSLVLDASEIAQWRKASTSIPTRKISLPFPCDLHLHAAYGLAEIKATLGLASLARSGPTGLGVLHAKALRCYAHLVTFRKEEKDFSPTTRYQDYPISRTQLHWESQSTASQESVTGQNYRNFRERSYTILFFARPTKRIDGETVPFVFLGPAKALLSYHGNRPITMVWELQYPMPAELFEEARPA